MNPGSEETSGSGCRRGRGRPPKRPRNPNLNLISRHKLSKVTTSQGSISTHAVVCSNNNNFDENFLRICFFFAFIDSTTPTNKLLENITEQCKTFF